MILVYKFQWVRILSLGIVMTYGIHYVWVVNKIYETSPMPALFGMTTSNYHDFMNYIFLTSYWLVFFIGGHLIRPIKDATHIKTLAGANFGNIALYSVLSYPIVLNLFYTQRFTIILAEGLAYLAAALLMKTAPVP